MAARLAMGNEIPQPHRPLPTLRRMDTDRPVYACDNCGLHGTYHHVSVKHLGWYVDEFSGRHNVRPLDTATQMDRMAVGAAGKRLTYAELIGPKETRQPRML